MSQSKKFFDPRVEGRPLTLDEVVQNYQYSQRLMAAQFFYELPRAYPAPDKEVPIVRDKPRSQSASLALTLIEREVLETEGVMRPDYTDTVSAELAWRRKVRSLMAKRIRELLRPVGVRTKSGRTVRVRVALLKLRSMRHHQAFQRVTACEAHWTNKTRTCDCPTPASQSLRKFIAMLTKHDQPWLLLYVYMTYRGYVQHFYEYAQAIEGGTERDEHPNGDKRIWVGAHRDKERMVKWDSVVDEHGNEIDVCVDDYERSLVDGNKTRLLDAFDLMGWDRPTSWVTKTTRMAFCPLCKLKDSPWFRVKLKRVKGKYVRPAGEIAQCPRCGTDETAPQPRDKPITFMARRHLKQHRKLVLIEEVFERKRGRWYYSSTNEVCSRLLNNEIERRWLAKLPQKQELGSPTPPVVRENAEALATIERAIAVSDFTVYDESVLRRALVKFDKATDALDELPAGTLAARGRMLTALRAIDQRPPLKTRLVAFRDEPTDRWQSERFDRTMAEICATPDDMEF